MPPAAEQFLVQQMTTAADLQEVKYHPSSVDLELVKRLAAKTSWPTLLQFLVKEFSCIPKPLAGAHRRCSLT